MAVACNPTQVVRGSHVEELAEAWREARARWGADASAGLPIGMGFLSYDLGRQFERLRGTPKDLGAWPDLEFRFFDALALCPTGQGASEIWACNDAAAQALAATLGEAEDAAPVETAVSPRSELVGMEGEGQHLRSVGRVLEYIRAGDVYQVNVARRLACDFPAKPGEATGLELFLRLQSESPAPHALWFADPARGVALVGNSPERFVRVSPTGRIEACPIKGTRPHDASDPLQNNIALLRASAKDRAEHVMIVDLERNDLGRVCETGSVNVEDLCSVLTLPTVHHMVSTISGQLRPEVGLLELLRATFPGGSITGAPKIRAMEIIDDLEPARRGPYTGATGWLGAAGDLDLAIAIRTALVREEKLVLWVGGGIVADSVPEEELAETWHKAEAFRRALHAG